MSRLRAAVAALVLALALPVLVSCGQSGVDRGVGAPGLLQVTRGQPVEHLLLTGELEAVSSDPLVAPRTRSWALTIRWMEEDGTPVKAGQKVLEFDNSEVTSQLEEKRLAALQAQNDYDRQRAENDLTLAERQFAAERTRIELDKAAISADVPEDVYPGRLYQELQLGKERAESAAEQAAEDLAAGEKSTALDSKVKRVALDTARREITSAERTLDA
ncbi:MAG: hypothetical protein AAGC55_34035, partial [Myxococcota bacterium]